MTAGEDALSGRPSGKLPLIWGGVGILWWRWKVHPNEDEHHFLSSPGEAIDVRRAINLQFQKKNMAQATAEKREKRPAAPSGRAGPCHRS